MFAGRNFWRQFSFKQRHQGILDALTIFSESDRSNRVFAAIVDKRRHFSNPQTNEADPVEMAFEQIASRFDYYLQRLFRYGDKQKGLILFDKTSYELRMRPLSNHLQPILEQ